MAGATFRDVSTVTGSGTTFTINTPAGFQAGDALYAVIQHATGVGLTTRPGVTSIKASTFNGGTFRLIEWDAGSVGAWTFGFNASTAYVCHLIAIAPAAPGDTLGVDVYSLTGEGSANSGPVVIPSVTTTAADDLVVWALGIDRGTTFAPPAGITERADAKTGNTVADHTAWIGTQAVPAVGATGTRSITNDNPNALSGSRSNMLALAIKETAALTSWVADMETGDLSQWAALDFNQTPNQVVDPNTGALVASDGTPRAQVISGTVGQPDGPYEGTKFLRLVCDNGDVYPLTPTANARSMVKGSRVGNPGETWWFSFAMRLPADFPVVREYPDNWMLLWELFGPPFTGSPNLALQPVGEELWFTNYGTTFPFARIPLVRGVWQHFALRVKLSLDPTIGWVETYVNGRQLLLNNEAGSGNVRRLFMGTLPLSATGKVENIAFVYHKVNGPTQRITADYDVVRSDQAIPPTLGNGVLLDRPVRIAKR